MQDHSCTAFAAYYCIITEETEMGGMFPHSHQDGDGVESSSVQ